MRKYKWLLFIPAVLLVVASIAMVSLAEYTKTGQCYRTGTTLSAEELREKTIRSLISAEVEETTTRINEYKKYATTFLIPRSLKPNEVIDAIASKSIVDLAKEAAYTLETDGDVARIDAELIREGFSLVTYRKGSFVQIMPSESIQIADANSAARVFADMDAHHAGLSLFERAQGNGNHVFQIDYYGIDSGCCEEVHSKFPKHGKSQAQYAQESIDWILRGKKPNHYNLLVSNCGEILQRKEEGAVRDYDIRILF